MGHGASSKNKYSAAEASSDAVPKDSPATELPIEPTKSTSSSTGKKPRTHYKGHKLRVQIPVSKPDLTPQSIASVGRHIRFTDSFISEYVLGEEVMPSTNAGTYVHYATRISDSKDVVIKVRTKAQSFHAGVDSLNAWKLSTECLMNLPTHEHITELYEVLEDSKAYYVVMEKVDGLDLFEALSSPERPDRGEIQQILAQLLEAVAALHAKGYIHRDLKLENVMVESPKSSKVGFDFGDASIKSPTAVSMRALLTGDLQANSEEDCVAPYPSLADPSPEGVDGKAEDVCTPEKSTTADLDANVGAFPVYVPPMLMTPDSPVVKIIDFDTVEDYSPKRVAKVVMGTDMYIAHEAYSGHYSPASDIFAIGVIAYKLLTGKFPFTDEVFADGDNIVGSPCMKQTQEALLHFEIDWVRPPFDTDTEALDLCRWMLASVDVDRPTAVQAQAHPWFSAAPAATEPRVKSK